MGAEFRELNDSARKALAKFFLTVRYRIGNGQVDDDEQDSDRLEVGSVGSYASAVGALRDSGRFSREMLQRRQKKRARAWRVFVAVMQVRSN